MENNKNKKSVKFQGDMLIFYDFIQVFVFTTNHHLNLFQKWVSVFKRVKAGIPFSGTCANSTDPVQSHSMAF